METLATSFTTSTVEENRTESDHRIVYVCMRKGTPLSVHVPEASFAGIGLAYSMHLFMCYHRKLETPHSSSTVEKETAFSIDGEPLILM